MNDELGDRMKMYEQAENSRRLMSLLPILVRLDGKCFHTFAKNLEKPFSPAFHDCMVTTTYSLMHETNALVGYTQSDEITLVLYSSDTESQLYFGGRTQKINSVLAATASVYFNKTADILLPDNLNYAVFDCRSWNVPTLSEAINCLIWREQDALRNATNMIATCHFSHKELENKNNAVRLEMLADKGVDVTAYPAWARRGVFLRRDTVTTKFTSEEISNLPEKHAAKLNPDLEVTRYYTQELQLPCNFSQLKNKIDVVFSQADPLATD